MTHILSRVKSMFGGIQPALLKALLVALLVSACTSTQPPSTQPTTTQPTAIPDPAPDPAPATVSPPTQAPPSEPVLTPNPQPPVVTAPQTWTLDEGLLIIHVGKTGRLARLGHNHLVSTGALTGSATLDTQGELVAEVSLNVSDLNVDDPQLRARYRQQDNGKSPWATAYASSPSEKNIKDTRANMLGKRVLDIEQHPEIEVVARAKDAGDEFMAAESGRLLAELSVSIKARRVVIPAELTWQRLPTSEISWQSSFDTTHKALGLTPFSALGGALAVAEPLRFEVSGVLNYSGTVQIAGPSVGRH